MAINNGMESLHRYCGYTLVDITQTGVLSIEPQHKRNQQRNWETVNQILSLRAQLLNVKYLGFYDEELTNHSFGINYTGFHRVWQFEFSVDRDGLYNVDHDRYSTLKDDFMTTPVILNLDETAKPPLPLFYASGPDKNIYFKTLV